MSKTVDTKCFISIKGEVISNEKVKMRIAIVLIIGTNELFKKEGD